MADRNSDCQPAQPGDPGQAGDPGQPGDPGPDCLQSVELVKHVPRIQFSLRWMFGLTAAAGLITWLIQAGVFACLVAIILTASLAGSWCSREAGGQGGQGILGGTVGGSLGALGVMVAGILWFYLWAERQYSDEALVGGFLFTLFVYLLGGSIAGFITGCLYAFAASVYEATYPRAIPVLESDGRRGDLVGPNRMTPHPHEGSDRRYESTSEYRPQYSSDSGIEWLSDKDRR